MRPLPPRLSAFLALVAVVTVLALIRASQVSGQAQVIWFVLGSLGVVSLLLMAGGWIRESRRR